MMAQTPQRVTHTIKIVDGKNSGTLVLILDEREAYNKVDVHQRLIFLIATATCSLLPLDLPVSLSRTKWISSISPNLVIMYA